VPLIAFAVVAYAAGLVAGFVAGVWWPAVTASVLGAIALRSERWTSHAACALVFAVGVTVAIDAGRPPPRHAWSAQPSANASVLERWRDRAGKSIDRLFGSDAPVVRALLIADTRQLPADIRDRYSRAGLVHLLSISGLHVAIISGSVLLALQMLRIGPGAARWLAVAITALYVIAIGAPPPALRSGAMLAATTLARALQRPVSPWATLALGALVPLLVDPRTVLDLGYQLSVAGFAALVGATIWTKRVIPRDMGKFRRQLLSELSISTIASFASAPLVAWHFARISLIAPVTNILAAPVVAVMQPALFLALVLAPTGAPAQLVADGARPLVRALDAIALVGSRVPGASIIAAPSFAVACIAGLAAVCTIAAAASRRGGARWAIGAVTAVVAMVWWPLAPVASRGMDVHMIDVGQGDAVAIRSPRGRWIVVDAGGGRASGDAGRRVAIPYLRRLGGEVALFVMTHPHDDHVGGAATLISQLAPNDVRDAAFAGTSPSYREALEAARSAGIRWKRIAPGDSIDVDGVVATFLAPDSAWTSTLTDPNLASAVVRVQFGEIRVLLTGDAEGPEEEWLVQHAGPELRADVLKVAHHGSATSTTSAFLAAVRPSIALISVGQKNRYRHPSPDIVDSLTAHGVRVLRTDQQGTILLRTDPAGTRIGVVSSPDA
jgi:competence protein ComEC